jgi:PAS domain S-box-containing protein
MSLFHSAQFGAWPIRFANVAKIASRRRALGAGKYQGVLVVLLLNMAALCWQFSSAPTIHDGQGALRDQNTLSAGSSTMVDDDSPIESGSTPPTSIAVIVFGVIGCSVLCMGPSSRRRTIHPDEPSSQHDEPSSYHDETTSGVHEYNDEPHEMEPGSRMTLIQASLVAALVFAFDLSMPLGVAAAVPYVFVVLFSLKSNRSSHALIAAAAGTALTILGFALSHDGGNLWMVLANRALAILAVWVTAILCISQQRISLEQGRLTALKHAADREKDLVRETLQKLKASETKARAILESAADGIVTIDHKGTIQSINRTALKIFGYPDTDLTGQSVNILMPMPYRDTHDAYLSRYMETGVGSIVGTSRDVRGQRQDGTTFPMNLSVSELLIDDRPLFTGIARDITEQKRAEEELRQSRQGLEEANERLSESAREQEAFNALTVGRELRMVELKEEINSLREQLGQLPKYQIVDDEVRV